MSKHIVHLAEVPSNITIHHYIIHKFGLETKFNSMTYCPRLDPLLKFKLDGLDSELALQSVKDAVSLYGWHGFMTHFFDTKSPDDRDPYYGGFSITHNPDLKYVPEHASALGESKMNLHDFFSTDYGRSLWPILEERKIAARFFEVCFLGGLPAVKEYLLQTGVIENSSGYDWNKPFISKEKLARGSYYDAYAFRQFTPAGQHGYHGEFLKTRLKRSLCRSRVAYINGSQFTNKTAEYMWHRDENIFTCMRINIPLQTTPNYVIETKGYAPLHFEVGSTYTWDTQIMHRVYALQRENSQRINIVLGVCPWFDYDAERQAYVSNEFFGELHPFDMLAQGHVFRGTVVNM